MPTYPIYLNYKLDQIASRAGSETQLTVHDYLVKIITEHLNRIENQNPLDKVVGK